MNMFAAPKRRVPAPQAMRTLSSRDVETISGGTPGEQNPIHRPAPHPIVYVPILTPFPIGRPRG